jgi:hypothetical protein
MASGRLAAAVVPSGRTQLVYTNSSGGAVSATILTKSLDATTDAKVSMAIDSATVSPEITTQIDTTSRNYETTPVVFFNSGLTAVEGSMTMTNSNLGVTIVDGATSNTTNGLYSTAAYLIPNVTGGDKDFNPSNRHIPFLNNNTLYSVSPSVYAADYPNHWKVQFNDNTPASYTSNASLNYTGQGFTCDPYTHSNPFWSVNSSRYMGWGRVSNATGGLYESQESSSAWYYQQIGGVTTQNFYRTMLMARGGVLGYGSASTSLVSFMIYKGWTEALSSNYLTPDNNTGSTHALKISFSFSNTNFDGSSLKWVEYNPHVDKVYACYWDDGGFVMIEMDGPKLETLFASHRDTATQTAGYNDVAQAISTLGDLNPFTDITSYMPSSWDRTNNNWRMSPTFRIGDKLWYVNEGSTTNPLDANNKGWITSDFKTWTEVTGTSYYSQVVDSNTTIFSDADSTDKRVGNFDAVGKAGRLETDVTFSEIERTGLVLSNNDKLYVKNSGTVDANIQVMGFEEA